MFFPFLIGIVLFIVACFLKEENGRDGIAILGAVLALPCFVYSYTLTILHWKERYVGGQKHIMGRIVINRNHWMV